MSDAPFEKTAMRDPLIGASVNGYRVTGRLGEGGMGLVYEALQADIGKRVAIKVMRPELAADPSFFSRLLTEARAVNAIRHRGIVDIFGSAELPDGRHCILMEYLEGESLETALRAAAEQHRTLPVGDALAICDEVLNALGAAHQANIVHRDLKPSNIFLCRQPNGERHVKLLDFGIAKIAAGAPTQASAVMGTPLYMAPEQAAADTVTPAIDVYAFGVILFELLTGRVPFQGESVVRVMYHHINTAPPVPSSLAPSVPAALDALVAELLSKLPEARPSLVDVRRRLARLRVALADPSAVPTLDEPMKAFPVDALPSAELASTISAVREVPSGSSTGRSPGDVGPGSGNTIKSDGDTRSPGDLGPGASSVLPRPSRAPRVVALGLVAALGIAVVIAGVTPQPPTASPEPVVTSPTPPRAPTALTPPSALAPLVAPTPPSALAPVVVTPTPSAEEPTAITPPPPPALAPVAITPVPAPTGIAPTPPSTPAPVVVRPPPVSVVKRTSLVSRLSALDARVAAQKRAGEDVEISERQLLGLRKQLVGASGEVRERIESGISRLEQDLKP